MPQPGYVPGMEPGQPTDQQQNGPLNQQWLDQVLGGGRRPPPRQPAEPVQQIPPGTVQWQPLNPARPPQPSSTNQADPPQPKAVNPQY